jgi:hypothetical protein
MASIQDRNRQGSAQSTPESNNGVTGLFGRQKKPKKQEKIVIGSEHAAAAKQNNLMADPRATRKHQSVPARTVGVIAMQKSAHITAAEQEMRHPHSGPPAVGGAADVPMLTKIVSGDEDDEWD